MYATDDGMTKANQDDYRLERTNAPQVAALSGASKDVYDEDPLKRNPHDDGCGEDESPSLAYDNDAEEDTVGEAKGKLTSNTDVHYSDDDDHDGRNAFEGNVVELGVINEDPKEKVVGQ